LKKQQLPNWPNAQALGEKLAGATVKITQKAGVDGRLFGL
jgi:large subunit ribosomal protein L9